MSSESLWSEASTIDHRLMRARILRELEEGRRGLDEVCDAHPDLGRAGENFGSLVEAECPICGKSALVAVQYAFGKGLPPSGQVVGGVLTKGKLRCVADLTVCDVEVCLQCHWNHLIRQSAFGEEAV